MLRKNIAPVVATILSGLLFVIIGSCFSAFVYKKEIIKVENPKLIISQGISVYDKKGEQEVDVLELSKMKLGLKPATGEEDSITNIPVTVTDKQGSEGQYGKIKVLAPKGTKIYVTNLKIDSEEDKTKINKEKENIMIAIKQIEDSAASLNAEKVYLATLNSSEEKTELTFYVWLSGKASDVLEASTISFDISFESIE